MTLESILDGRNVLNALSQVVGNGGAPGVDGMKTEEVKPYLMEHWRELQKAILEGRYRPQAVRRIEIPKPNGGVRQLGIPTVLDRVLQQSIAQELDKLYDNTFSEYSYGFRNGRNAHDAIEQALKYLNEGRHYVVEIDLEKFFDRVNHDKLMFGLSLRTLTITIPRLKERGYIPLMELYTHKRNTLTNRRDTRTVRPVV